MKHPHLSPEDLLGWYDSHRRDLPWRRTSDPYGVWVSEIMLQQTQVATVIDYWLRWMERFPDVQSLASADEQEVLSLWQGLGYYRRCRMLHAGAKYVAEHGLPQSADEWLKVPGIGAYTAGAIASIAQGQASALVDGNVERVYARLYADDSAGPALNRAAWRWAVEVVDRARPGDWNQALMELGATVCTPKNPLCLLCPVQSACVGRANHRVSDLPKKVAKPKPKNLKHLVWVPAFEGRLGMRQIPTGAWWEGMWEFPRLDVTLNETEEQLVDIAELRSEVGLGSLEYVGEIRHTVTNHRISVEVHLVRCESMEEALTWKLPSELDELPMPAPQRRILAAALNRL